MKKATLICDLGFGSSGKGLIAGYLAERDCPDVVVTAWSLNAGHTYIDDAGRTFVHCMLANGVVSPALQYILIGPGSQIGIDRLRDEIFACADLLVNVQILVHQNACIIQPRHIEAESVMMTGIGSTKKGVGAALTEKIARQRGSRIVARDFPAEFDAIESRTGIRIRVVENVEYMLVLDRARRIQIEGAQGYSLGINSGFYPYVTSRECTPAQIASDCLVPMPMIGHVVGTMRTYPIRVANRYDDKGNMVGYSGPCYFDQEETSFEEIGQTTELTTVTKLPRRIFTFSEQQTRQAMFACRPDSVYLNFANYASPNRVANIIRTINDCAADFKCGGVKYLGYGPTRSDIQELK